MPPAIDPDSLGFVITDVGRLLRAAVEARIAEGGFGITPGAARALIHVAALDGPRQTALAERMGVEPMTVSAYVDRLEQCGLVERRPDPSDRRAKRVFVTEKAEATLTEVRALARSVLEDTLAEATPEERQGFEKVLRQVRSRLQETVRRDETAGDRPRGAAA